ncbi:hypothetical protein HUB98_05965 [Paenibacillus barcinonensis]|uniref:ACT domain-containing protein n=1 Tax=Paenibacillus barcinonensis TaxID=198119 RepID=A0A2V4VEQ5_PAEBA|nr:hypothetical protein [Paenibacillus barcinonensis]PYE51554.1 hypothetical protein DFQ00_102348 [Paenibacillus barcinonensis]QKS55927.1 hypothetical protein HUB98_05965 [Paenibacillus barcinonensis]
MEAMFDEVGVNIANEISNDYPVTFDEAYAFYVIAKGNVQDINRMVERMSVLRDMRLTILSYYKFDINKNLLD